MSNAAIVTPTDEIAAAKAELTTARLLKKEAKTDEEVAYADQQLILARKRYDALVPPKPFKRPDPDVTPEKVRTEARKAREQDREPLLGDVLEPEMQRLLANQTLRAGALREFERWLMWLREAREQCIGQPVSAQALVGEVITALEIKARDLKEAPVKQPRGKKGAQ